MRIAELIDDTQIGFGSLGTDNLEKARLLVSRALGIPLEDFKCRNSDYYDGSYYLYDTLMIHYSFDKKYRIICQTRSLEESNKIITYYNSILVKNKPQFN